MANQFHRAKLCEGALAWNLWRDTNPLVVPDLEEVALSPSQRQFGLEDWGPIDLRRACFGAADLRYACMTAADLEEANLSGANLTSARLERANLSRANLARAVLDDADLSGARLDAAVVDGARLGQTRNLAQSQIDRCLGDRETTLPSDLTRPTSWMRRGAAPEKADAASGPAPARSQGELGDKSKRAEDEIFKTIARAREVLAQGERKTGHGRAEAAAGVFKARGGAGANSGAASKRGLVYVAGSAIAAAIAALLFWSQWMTPAPAKPDNARGGVAYRPVQEPARVPGAAKAAQAAVLEPRDRVETIERRAATPSIAPPLREDAGSPDIIEPDIIENKPAAVPVLVDIAPANARLVAIGEGPAAAPSPPGMLVRETPPPPPSAARDAPEGSKVKPSSAVAVKEFVSPSLKASSAPRPRAAQARARRGDDASPHPFAAPPCKLTAGCRAGLEMCGC